MGAWFSSQNPPKSVLHSPVCMGMKFIITSLNGSLRPPFILNSVYRAAVLLIEKEIEKTAHHLVHCFPGQLYFFNLNLRDNQYPGMHCRDVG